MSVRTNCIDSTRWKLMVQFEASEPTFFSEFVSARKIGQVGSQSSKDKQGIMPLSKAA